MIRELIAPTADAVVEPVEVPRNHNPGARVAIGASLLNGSEEIKLWVRWTADGSWERLADSANSGALVAVTTSGPVVLRMPSMRLGVTKDATLYAVGVYIATQDLVGGLADA